MNPKWFGDSFDIVKRFFALSLRDLNYDVFIDPMLTGSWDGNEERLYGFLKMRPVDEYRDGVSALFLDPDTGVGRSSTPKHTTISSIVALSRTHEIVFSFDQSFSRGSDSSTQIEAKLAKLTELGAFGFYFDSHARFLFASSEADRVNTLQDYLVRIGLPRSRLVSCASMKV